MRPLLLLLLLLLPLVHCRLRSVSPGVPLFASSRRVVLLYAAFWLGALPLVHIYESALIVPHCIPAPSMSPRAPTQQSRQQDEPSPRSPPLPRGFRRALACAWAAARACTYVPLASMRLCAVVAMWGVRLWVRVAARVLPWLGEGLLPWLMMWLPGWAQLSGADVIQWLLALVMPGWIGAGWAAWLVTSALTRAVTWLLPSSVRGAITTWSGAELITTLLPKALPWLASLLRMLWATLALAWRVLFGTLALARALVTAVASLASCGSVDILDGSFYAALADRGVAVVVFGGPEFDCVQAFRRARDAGVHAVCTDRPALLRKLLQAEGPLAAMPWRQGVGQ
jgi:hypothetical protein